jgi:hypothetical protein
MNNSVNSGRPKPQVRPLYRVIAVLLVMAIIAIAMWDVLAR